MKLQLLKPYCGFNAGAMVDFPPGIADALLTRKPPIAKVYEEEVIEAKAVLYAPENKAIQPAFDVKKKRRRPFSGRD